MEAAKSLASNSNLQIKVMVVHTSAWLCDNKYKLLIHKDLLELLVKNKNVSQKIRQVGWCGRDQLRDYYEQSKKYYLVFYLFA